ncbi:hypothetical protein MKEN_00910200 [Mycena kentingensis (nom. inval.)]|nr:hypothetical protein MKEN_00910200 [Mycena kentingensis (nom. inval.)]
MEEDVNEKRKEYVLVAGSVPWSQFCAVALRDRRSRGSTHLQARRAARQSPLSFGYWLRVVSGEPKLRLLTPGWSRATDIERVDCVSSLHMASAKVIGVNSLDRFSYHPAIVHCLVPMKG